MWCWGKKRKANANLIFAVCVSSTPVNSFALREQIRNRLANSDDDTEAEYNLKGAVHPIILGSIFLRLILEVFWKNCVEDDIVTNIEYLYCHGPIYSSCDL